MPSKVLLGGKLMFPSDYLAAVEFLGRDVTLTIAGVRGEDLAMRGGKKERKPVLSFRETKKRLVLNKTNASSIADMHGTKAENWIGKKVTFYPTKTQCGRDTVDCVRVRESVNARGSKDVQFDEPIPHEDVADDLPDSPFGQQPVETSDQNESSNSPDSPPPAHEQEDASGGGEVEQEQSQEPDPFDVRKGELFDILIGNKHTKETAKRAWDKFLIRHKGCGGKNGDERKLPAEAWTVAFKAAQDNAGDFTSPN